MTAPRFILPVGLLLLAFMPGPLPLQADEPDRTRGAELLAPFKYELKQALLDGMQEGPLNAISVCKDQAPAIADTFATDGTKIGRASHRLRNRRNVAPDWANQVLTGYLDNTVDRAPKVVSLPDQREGYAEPIMVQPLCLACHGETLAPDVAAYIAETYPEDEATGFEAGDLRGIFWVEYSTTDF